MRVSKEGESLDESTMSPYPVHDTANGYVSGIVEVKALSWKIDPHLTPLLLAQTNPRSELANFFRYVTYML
jgi:hypothetical protein